MKASAKVCRLSTHERRLMRQICNVQSLDTARVRQLGPQRELTELGPSYRSYVFVSFGVRVRATSRAVEEIYFYWLARTRHGQSGSVQSLGLSASVLGYARDTASILILFLILGN